MADIPRQTALRSLLDLDSTTTRPDSIINKRCSAQGLIGRDRAFVGELVYGVTRHRRALDYLISHGSRRQAATIDIEALFILRMGLYQCLAMDRARFAAVNESVALAKSWGKTSRAAGFINGALRGTLRVIDAKGLSELAIDEVVAGLQPENLEAGQKLGERYSFPDYWARRWIRNFGYAKAERIMEACQKKSPVYIRLNDDANSNSQIEEKLLMNNISTHAFKWATGLLEMTDGVLAPDSALITEGLIQPQDGASYIAARLLEAACDETVLDVCCGKGIKTGYFAQKAGRVLAMDKKHGSLMTMQENMRRQRLDNIVAIEADMVNRWPIKETFGRIFIDAPCSGSGLARRHPEGKWTKSEELIFTMAKVQRRILERVADCLAPGGRLVYAICSVEPEEGKDNVDRFLSHSKHMERIAISAINPKLAELQTDDGDMLAPPGIWGIDGFYASVITNKR